MTTSLHMTLKKTFLLSCLVLAFIWTSHALGTGKTHSWELTLTGTTLLDSESKVKITDTSATAAFFLALKKPVRVGLFFDDASLFRFVSRATPLSSREYKPDNIVAIAGDHINEAGRINYIRADAKASLLELATAFEAHFGEPLVVISGYRSASYQKRLWDLGKCSDSLCAPPWYSEHQLGLAIDIFDATNNSDFNSNRRYRSYVTWMQQYGHFYGWTQSYQKWEKIDGYQIEPWHWRYIGKEMATRLKKLGWTFTEYVRFQEAIQRR